MNEKKVRLRFSYEDDILLLREFINVNPIQNPDGWAQIQQHLQIMTKKIFKIRTLKNHLMLLLELFLKKIKDEEVRSGVEEAFSEKDRLLEEVSSLCRETNYSFKQPRKKTGLSKEQQLCELGKKARNMFAADFYTLEEKEEDENHTHLEPNSKLNNSPQVVDHDYFTVEDTPEEYLEVVVNETNLEDSQALQNNATAILPTTPKDTLKSFPNTSKECLTNEENLATSSPNNKTSKNVMVPTRRRLKPREPVRKNALSYLKEKFEKENIIKNRELELENRKVAIEEKKIKMEERRLVLEEKRFDLEYKERMEKLNLEKQKIEMDLKDKRITQQMFEVQQQLINNVLRNC